MTVEGDNPVDSGTAQPTAAPKSAAELFAEMEADPSQAKVEEDDDEQDAGPQGEPEAEDEPEADEAEGEDSEAPDEDETPEAEGQEPQSVEIDGKAIPLSEVKDGYLRQQDYTRKTQALAEEKREFTQAVERVALVDQEARQALAFSETIVKAVLPPIPDHSLLQVDPVSYYQQKEHREQVARVMDEIRGKQKAQIEAEKAQKAEEARIRLEQQNKVLAEKVPDFAKAEFRKQFRDEAIDLGAKFYGLTSHEVDSIESATELLVLRDALAYRKLVSSTPNAVAKAKQAPKIVAKPGTRENPKSRNLSEQLKNLGRGAKTRDIFLLMEKGS